jgi:cell division protein FtsW (lipid II flippase)
MRKTYYGGIAVRRKFALMVVMSACMISVLLIPGLAIHAEAKRTLDWLILSTEIFTPALLIALALIVYLAHKARDADHSLQ